MSSGGVAIIGATGRLGSAIHRGCADAGVAVLATADSTGWHGTESATPEVVIDASRPAALPSTIDFCTRTGAALLYCVSNQTPAGLRELRALSDDVPVAVATNLSPLQWVQTRVAELSAQLAAALPLAVEVTVIDRHPVSKTDAPSATAQLLASAMSFPATVVSERFGPRVCDHRVVFTAGGETFDLVHTVRDLDLVAAAAVRLAGALADSEPGWFTTDELYSRLLARTEEH
ncbi:dihydrodipicolinate reductase C-terminal domain-containing protein [Nocardia sp. NPDC050378]|uniref:dihydrodipicolinate reductase C-terminal domain-containing protein n=1 Tax=Nocardia sp. NPDC050378 TaxID=3155400 RepID=UPI0033EE84EB